MSDGAGGSVLSSVDSGDDGGNSTGSGVGIRGDVIGDGGGCLSRPLLLPCNGNWKRLCVGLEGLVLQASLPRIQLSHKSAIPKC